MNIFRHYRTLRLANMQKYSAKARRKINTYYDATLYDTIFEKLKYATRMEGYKLVKLKHRLQLSYQEIYQFYISTGKLPDERLAMVIRHFGITLILKGMNLELRTVSENTKHELENWGRIYGGVPNTLLEPKDRN